MERHITREDLEDALLFQKQRNFRLLTQIAEKDKTITEMFLKLGVCKMILEDIGVTDQIIEDWLKEIRNVTTQFLEGNG